MTKEERYKLINEIGKKLEMNIITYVTLTRPNLDIEMAMDSIRYIYEHLRKIETPKEETKIALFLHSNGGDIIVPWKLVTLIREYCNEFHVIVPHHAFSAATLTALGANTIIMHPMGMLGPTDPTVTNPFNPPNPRNAQELLGISVEDVTAYISLIKEDVGIRHEDELVQAFNILAQQVHPLALGNVKRIQSQSRMLAKKLMYLHKEKDDEHKVNEIVDKLTSKLFFHGHPINRTEAKDIGLDNIIIPEVELEDLIWKLYCEYENEMKLNSKFSHIEEFVKANPSLLAGKSNILKLKQKAVYIESNGYTNVNIIDFEIIGTKLQNGLSQAQLSVLKHDWEEE